MNKLKKLSLVAGAAVLTNGAFAAQIFGADVTVDTAPVITMAGIVITAIASIWAIKKVVSLGNKS